MRLKGRSHHVKPFVLIKTMSTCYKCGSSPPTSQTTYGKQGEYFDCLGAIPPAKTILLVCEKKEEASTFATDFTKL